MNVMGIAQTALGGLANSPMGAAVQNAAQGATNYRQGRVFNDNGATTPNRSPSPAPAMGPQPFGHSMYDAEGLSAFDGGWLAAAQGGANPRASDQTMNQYMSDLRAWAQPVADFAQPAVDALSSSMGFLNDSLKTFAGSPVGKAIAGAGQGVSNYRAGRPFNVNEDSDGTDIYSIIRRLTPQQLAELRAMLGD